MDGFTEIAITGQVASQRLLTTEFVDDCLKFVYHSAAYDSGRQYTLTPTCNDRR